MKKVIVLLLAFALCVGLCACGRSAEAEIENTQTDADAEESTQPAETGIITADAGFREEDYIKSERVSAQGETFTSWHEGSATGRKVREIRKKTNGDIYDSYYYPDGRTSHIYIWLADGTYAENRFQENGVMNYLKQLNPDGTEDETFYDENGKVTRNVRIEADGARSESYYENGKLSRNVYCNAATGEQIELEFYENGQQKKYTDIGSADGSVSVQEFYENGNLKSSVFSDPVAGRGAEQECYENGDPKWNKSWSAEYAMETRYNEEGYYTYFYYKDEETQFECFADETGKLVKVIENGEVKEDASTFARYEEYYNFRK